MTVHEDMRFKQFHLPLLFIYCTWCSPRRRTLRASISVGQGTAAADGIQGQRQSLIPQETWRACIRTSPSAGEMAISIGARRTGDAREKMAWAQRRVPAMNRNGRAIVGGLISCADLGMSYVTMRHIDDIQVVWVDILLLATRQVHHIHTLAIMMVME